MERALQGQRYHGERIRLFFKAFFGFSTSENTTNVAALYSTLSMTETFRSQYKSINTYRAG